MGLCVSIRPSDSSIANLSAGEAVSVLAKDRIKELKTRIKSKKHGRVSDTSGNVTCGGPGSGPRPGEGGKSDVEDWLGKNGWEKDKTSRDPSGSSYWRKTLGGGGQESGKSYDSKQSTHHLIKVSPSGEWTHMSEGYHSGANLDALQHLPLSASTNAVTGKGVVALREFMAKDYPVKKRKKLAKQKKALPDGSFPIANKQDLEDAKHDVGRAKNPAKARRWINKRAKELHAPPLGASVQAKTFSDEKRKKLAKKGKAMPNGSFPIENVEDLARAKKAFGRSRNKAATRRWIDKRAKQLHRQPLGGKVGKKKVVKARNNFSVEYYSSKLKAGGPGSGRKPEGGEKGQKDFHELPKTIQRALLKRFSKAISIANPKLKALGEDNLTNRKISDYMLRSSVRKMLKAGGPGSGRRPSGISKVASFYKTGDGKKFLTKETAIAHSNKHFAKTGHVISVVEVRHTPIS